jgi:hypothetical protein
MALAPYKSGTMKSVPLLCKGSNCTLSPLQGQVLDICLYNTAGSSW